VLSDRGLLICKRDAPRFDNNAQFPTLLDYYLSESTVRDSWLPWHTSEVVYVFIKPLPAKLTDKRS